MFPIVKESEDDPCNYFGRIDVCAHIGRYSGM